MPEIKKRIILKLQGFEIRGMADVTMWGGGNGCIEMKPFKTASTDAELVKAGINDAGFGVQSINGAVCDVYAVYSDNDDTTCTKFIETITVGTVSEDTFDRYNEQF